MEAQYIQLQNWSIVLETFTLAPVESIIETSNNHLSYLGCNALGI